ncbi:YDG domain-containing protein [Anaerofustis stercorihominis]|uniref:YDG domain-containing protein n=1 Tax=Anaerofustis stercorihominis TaxID=214853 RepID=UPI00210EF41D|nr:YDG domain-containing protein [Anaerofustis stercorihominis]MCQ4795186.1 YDG domain-containing protein [Anaerofustis stercorihominis]
MDEFKPKRSKISRKIIGMILTLVLMLCLFPSSNIFAADNAQASEIEYLTNQSGFAFNVRGMPGSFKTTYSDRGYISYLRITDSEVNNAAASSGTAINSLPNGVVKRNINGVTGFDLTQTLSFTNENRYVKIQYTLTNNTGKDKFVALGSGADIQIVNNDSAPIYRTDTGIRMAESTDASSRQFNFVCEKSYGVTDVDTLYYGPYGQYPANMFSGIKTTGSVLNIDSGMSFGWINRLIRDGETKTYSVLLGIGSSATPPQLMQDISAVCNGDKVDVEARFKDINENVEDAIYYVFDMDTENETPAEKLIEVDATGEVQTLKASIPKPSSWQVGEVHTVSVWVMNTPGAMSDIKTVRVVVEGDDEVREAEEYYLSFNGGQGAVGTAPSSIKAYEQDYVTLPNNTFTKENCTFGGWKDSEGNIYPAGTKFKMPSSDTTLTAYWVEGTENAMYTVEYYKQNVKDDNYTLAESKSFEGTVGETVTAPEKTYTGFDENTTTALRKESGEVASGLRLKRYYDRKMMNVTFNGNGGNASQASASVRYGGMLEMPTATRQYYAFQGWYDSLNNQEAKLYNNLSPITSDLTLYASWDAALDFITPKVSGTYGAAISNVTLVPSNAASSDAPNVKFEIVSGSLPEGLEMSETGVISGTPKIATNGDINIQVKCTDLDTNLTKTKQVTINIAKKELTVTGIDITTAPTKVYDGTNTISKASLDAVSVTEVSGLLAEDQISASSVKSAKSTGLTIKATAGTYDNKNAGENKNYTITKFSLSGDKAANYTIAPYIAGNNGVITKRDITIKPTPDSMDRNDAVPAFGVKITNGSLGKGDTIADLGTPVFECKNDAGVSPSTGGEIGDFVLKITSINNQSSNYNITLEEVAFRVRDKHTVTTSKAGDGVITATKAYDEDSTAIITWEPKDNYRVKRVIVDGEVRDDLLHAGQITFAGIREDHTVFVEFTREELPPVNQYYSIDTVKKGGDGNCSITSGCTVKKGDNKTISWNAGGEYKVSKVTIDGVVQNNPDENGGSITFNSISSNHDVQVVFEKKSAPAPKEDFYTITTSYEGEGSIDPSKTVKKGSACTISWKPAGGWYVDKVIIDGVEKEGLRKGEFENITADHTIKVIFAKDTPTGGNPDPDNPDVDNPDIDTPDNPDIDNPDDNPTTDVTQTYRVNTQIKNGVGDISPSVTVNKGEDYTVSWHIETGYEIDSVEVKMGNVLKPNLVNGNKVILTNITDDYDIIVTLKPVDTSADPDNNKESFDIITGIKGGEGTITPSALDVEKGTSHKVEWSVEADYTVQSVIVDGVARDELRNENSEYNINSVEASHSVYVFLSKENKNDGANDGEVVNPDGLLTVTTEIVGKGSITPSKIVEKGGNYKVEWAPADGYVLKEVYIDGNKSNLPVNFVDFNNILVNHSVKVVFVKDDEAHLDYIPGEKYQISTGIVGGKGSISPSATLQKDDDYNVEWNIDEGYVVKSVIVDGVYREDLKNVQGSQDFNSIKANHSVYVYVETKDNSSNNKPANNLTVSTETVGKGSITPTAVKKKGNDHVVTWKPASGYVVKEVYVDGLKVNLSEDKIEFKDLASNHHVKVIFVKESEKDEIYQPSENDIKIETSIIGGKGTITGTATLKKGDDHTVKWTVEKGYQVKTIIVDGKERKDLLNSNSITFKDLSKNHKVQVVLMSDEEAAALEKENNKNNSGKKDNSSSKGTSKDRKNENKNNIDTPDTSDNSNAVIYGLIALIAVAGLGGTIFKIKRVN